MLSTLVPILISLIFLAAHLKYRKVHSFYFSLFLILTYLVLPVVSRKTFSVFRCDAYDYGSGVERRFLAVDQQIECFDDAFGDHDHTYGWLTVYAVLSIIIYPIGIPALYTALLWEVRDVLATDELKKTTTYFEFFFSDAARREPP